MTLSVRFLVAVLILLTCSAVGAADSIAGIVKAVQGEATLTRGGQTIACREGTYLMSQDVIQTSSDGRLGAILQDGTRISLGPNAELTLDRFVYEPVEGRFGLLLKLLRGVMVYVSGKIAEFSPQSIRIETPVAAVGNRGTRVAISLEGP